MDEKTKEDAFYTNLEFGTAGMRGLIGAGTCLLYTSKASRDKSRLAAKLAN